jgi:hypothetical protein
MPSPRPLNPYLAISLQDSSRTVDRLHDIPKRMFGVAGKTRRSTGVDGDIAVNGPGSLTLRYSLDRQKDHCLRHRTTASCRSYSYASGTGCGPESRGIVYCDVREEKINGTAKLRREMPVGPH